MVTADGEGRSEQEEKAKVQEAGRASGFLGDGRWHWAAVDKGAQEQV